MVERFGCLRKRGLIIFGFYLVAVAATNDDWGSAVLLIGVVALIAIPLVIFIGSLVSIVSSSRYTVFGKIIWIVVTFCFPILGPIVWFIWGRNAESIVKN